MLECLSFSSCPHCPCPGGKLSLWPTSPDEATQAECDSLPCSQLRASQKDAGFHQQSPISSLLLLFHFCRCSDLTLQLHQIWHVSIARNILSSCKEYRHIIYRYLLIHIPVSCYLFFVEFQQEFDPLQRWSC